MSTVAWFHPFSGIAGDMALGACVDAGADPAAVHAALATLGVRGWDLSFHPVLRGGISATHAVVEVAESSVVRTAENIFGIIGDAALAPRVKERAMATFVALAEVEGRLHGRPTGQVHFHEVGGVDAIVDIVGTCAALESLGVDEVESGPVATGTGSTDSAHGVIPVPAPAVVALLDGARTVRVDVDHELTTPTGAALLAAIGRGFGPLPEMVITGSGYGAGTRDLDGRVNAVQLIVGQRSAPRIGRGGGQPLVELTVNVDDATGETLAHSIEALLDAGAADAWVTPVVMKKGRPGHVVSALVDDTAAAAVAEVLMAETGSFGVRARAVDRWPASRRFDSVDVDGHEIRIKISPQRTKVEHDDAASVARRTGRPLREVVSLAEEAARRRGGHPSSIDFDPDLDPDAPA